MADCSGRGLVGCSYWFQWQRLYDFGEQDMYFARNQKIWGADMVKIVNQIRKYDCNQLWHTFLIKFATMTTVTTSEHDIFYGHLKHFCFWKLYFLLPWKCFLVGFFFQCRYKSCCFEPETHATWIRI